MYKVEVIFISMLSKKGETMCSVRCLYTMHHYHGGIVSIKRRVSVTLAFRKDAVVRVEMG